MKFTAAIVLLSAGAVVSGACSGHPLTSAAAEGDTKTLASLLSSSKLTCDPVSPALFCALDANQLGSIMTLLENQRAVKCLREDFTSPLDLALIKAASMNDEQTAMKAFTLIIKLSKSERIGLSWLAKSKAILCAATRGYDTIAHFTEIHKDSIDSIFLPTDLQEALEIASSIPGNKMLRTVAYLMKSEPLVSPAANKHKAFYNACRSGNSELVQLFLWDDRVDPSLNDGFALLLAVDSGSFETVFALLEDDRVDPSVRNNQSFITAVEKGNIDIVEMLAKDIRVDTSTRNSQALLKAVESNDMHILVYLLEETAVSPSSSLIHASLDKLPIILEILLYDGRAEPSIHDMLECVTKEKYQHVQLLLQDGRVNPNAHNGAALQLIGKKGLQTMFWNFFHDLRIDIAIDNGGVLRETLENANSFGHKVILMTLLHDERLAKFIASRTWIKSLKEPLWPVAEHLLWFAHHFWKLRRDGKAPKVPKAYKPLCEIPNVRVLSLWLNKIGSAYEMADIEETMAILKKYATTWQKGVTAEFRAPDEFMLTGLSGEKGKGKEAEKKITTGSKSSHSSDSSESPRWKVAASNSTSTPESTNSSATSSTTSSFSIPQNSSSGSSSSSANGTPRTPKLGAMSASGDFIGTSRSRQNGMERNLERNLERK